MLKNCTRCHPEIKDADQVCYLAQSQYSDSGLTGPSTDSHGARRLAGFIIIKNNERISRAPFHVKHAQLR